MLNLRKKTGYLPNPFDPRDLWDDELPLAGEEPEIPETYKIEGLVYDRQGSYPFCVSMATTTAVEWAYKKATGISLRLSQPHLFFQSGGTEKGSWFRANLEVARKYGCISEASMSIPEELQKKPRGWHADMKERALGIPFDNPTMIPGYVRVNGADRDRLKRAIMKYGPIIVGVKTSRGWWRGSKIRSGTVNHGILLTGWDIDDTWFGHDSLYYQKDDTGHRVIHKDYKFTSAYAVTEMPRRWKKRVKIERETGFDTCLTHYGKVRDFSLEHAVASKLVKEFRKFKNQSVWEAAGKFWTVYINAVAYGGYNYKDVINSCYQWRRTGRHAFFFNKLRSEHKK